MAAFVYRAIDAAGRTQSGLLEANSAAGAREILRERNLLPLSTDPAAARVLPPLAGWRSISLREFFPPIRPGQLALLTRQLSTLVGSDVRIEDALRIVSQQGISTSGASVLLDVRAAILTGRSFANALNDHPTAFPEFYRASIAAGEESGKLDAVLAHLAEFVENRQRTRQRLQLAMLYPALLAVVSLGIMTMLLTYVVPDLARVFASRGTDLPWLTRGLIGLSKAVSAYGWMAAMLGLALAMASRQWLAVPKNRLRFHLALAQRWPVARFSRQLNSAQFAGTLATLVQSGVPLYDALSTAGAVTPNHHIRAQIAAAAARVREGISLRQALAQADCFTPMLIAVVASGESSGNLGPALARAAHDQERELDAWVSTLVALVEPGVLLLMGGLVLIMVLSILQPIINLNNLVGLHR